MKKITLFLMLYSSLTFAQGYEQAKNLLDRVSKEMKSKTNIRFDFDYVLENKKEQIRQEMEGNVTLAGDQYKLTFLDAIQLFDGTKTYTIVPENEEITIQATQRRKKREALVLQNCSPFMKKVMAMNGTFNNV